MTNSLSKAAFARTMGVHKSQVTRWAHSGMPVLADGTVDPERAAEWVHRNVDPTLRIHHARTQAQRRAAVASRPKRPTGTEHLTEQWEVVSVMFLKALAYRMPAAAASLAVASGASLPVAFTLSRAITMGVIQIVGELLDEADFDPPPGCGDWSDASMWEVEPMRAINWPALAESGGVEVDLEGWEAFAREKLSGPS